MGRGLFLGLLWGVIFSIAGGAVISLLAPLPPSPDAEMTVPGVGNSVAPDEDDSAMGPLGGQSGRDADLVELAPSAPMAQDAGDDLRSMAQADTRPAALPEVGAATGGLDRPADAGAAPEIADVGRAPGASGSVPVAPAAAREGDDPASLSGVDTDPAALPEVGAATGGLDRPATASRLSESVPRVDMPVTQLPRTDAPQAPASEAELSISTVPAQPALPEVDEAGSGFGAVPETESAPDVSDATDTGPAVPAQVVGVTPPQGETRPDPSTEAAAVPAQPGAGPQPLSPEPVEGPGRPVASGEQPVATAPQPGAVPDQPAAAPMQPATPEPGGAVAPRRAALPQAGGATGNPGPRIGTRVVPLTERNAAAPGTAEAVVPEGPALERHAAEYDDPGERPLMAIVLIDDAESLGGEALQGFPYPLSFAIDPALPGAAEKMARYRAAGFEVLLMIDLPATATARDAEVALAAGLDILPETVAIIEGVDAGIQGNRELSGQVTDIARATGRGLVTRDNGLNTVSKLAARSGVPSAIIFRDFDGAGQTPAVMRRFLDQAAFRAGQLGAVIMLGRVRPDTVSALLLWGLQDRASRVALVPVSAVLTRSQAQ